MACDDYEAEARAFFREHWDRLINGSPPVPALAAALRRAHEAGARAVVDEIARMFDEDAAASEARANAECLRDLATGLHELASDQRQTARRIRDKGAAVAKRAGGGG
jgi:hypothetical protein